MNARKNSIEAKQYLLGVCQNEQQLQFSYHKPLTPRYQLNQKPLFRCVTKAKLKTVQGSLLNTSTNFDKTLTNRNNSRCSMNGNQNVIQKISPKKILQPPKITIGSVPGLTSPKKTPKLNHLFQNRIKIVIRNCIDLKKQSQRIKTCK